MNGPPQSPTRQDPSLRALIERGLAQAQAREAAAGLIEEPSLAVGPPAEAVAPPPRTLGLTSDRACVETNLARKGIWRSASEAPAEGGELVRLLDATDQLGIVRRIDAGPPLGALAFDVAVWACTPLARAGRCRRAPRPHHLEAMADDLGWRKGGGAATELARALDTLRLATFRARVYNARLGEPHVDTFGLLDRWERGEPDRAGRPARAGFLVLGDCFRWRADVGQPLAGGFVPDEGSLEPTGQAVGAAQIPRGSQRRKLCRQRPRCSFAASRSPRRPASSARSRRVSATPKGNSIPEST